VCRDNRRIEHQPPKYLDNIDLNLEEYRKFLLSKFSRSYALQQLNNITKHYDCLKNPQGLSAFSASNRGNILKAMVNLAKSLGTYEDYKAKLKQHGIHWVNNDNSFNSFLRIVNNNHSNLGAWYATVQSILRPNEKLWLKFNLLSGLRKEESINSFNLIIQLNVERKTMEYFNEELGVLEHFKHGDMFLRHTKNCYISIVTKDLISEIRNSQPVTYSAIRKRLTRKGQPMRIKELRSYYATYLRNHGILAEYVDLIQGRNPRVSVC
jgi:hypothetical protein